MKKKKFLVMLSAVFFSACVIFTGTMFLREYTDARSSAKQFDDLTMLIADVEPPEKVQSEETEISEEELAAAYEKYGALYEQNTDFVGWIKIEGTNIDYPVMQTPNDPDYYLKHSFEKTDSSFGVPYVDAECVLGGSNNIIIYGHHMKNGTMFSDLSLYSDAEFCAAHPLIEFDTLSGFGTYEVVAAFKYDANHEEFRYNEYTHMREDQFLEFMSQVHARQCYDTGVEVTYGDRLLTLSTCEYSYKNGRFVVIAKKKS